MSLTRTGKINGSLIEALENVLNGPRIDFGLLRIVSAEKSGVIGICREYLTGAQLTGNGEVGMVALHTLCRTSRGIYTIHPTCEVTEFVAVNNELNIHIAEIIEQLKKSPPPMSQSSSQQIPLQQSEPAGQMQPEQVQTHPQMPDPASSQPMRAVAPLNALGGSSVPPPPAPGGMLNRVATSIGNALSGRYKAAGDQQRPDLSNSLEHSALVYDPNQMNKGKSVLNQVLGHARQTLSRLNPVKSLPQNQQPQATQHPAEEPAGERSALNNVMPTARGPASGQNPTGNPFGNVQTRPPQQIPAQPNMQQPRQPQPSQPQPLPPQFPPQPQIQIQPPQPQIQIQPPQPPQMQQPPQPQQRYEHPSQNPYKPQNQLPQQDGMSPTPSRRSLEEIQESSELPAPAPRQKLTDSTIVRANELYHQQVNNQASGRKRLRQGEQPKTNETPAPSGWSKLFFWRRGDE